MLPSEVRSLPHVRRLPHSERAEDVGRSRAYRVTVGVLQFFAWRCRRVPLQNAYEGVRRSIARSNCRALIARAHFPVLHGLLLSPIKGFGDQ